MTTSAQQQIVLEQLHLVPWKNRTDLPSKQSRLEPWKTHGHSLRGNDLGFFRAQGTCNHFDVIHHWKIESGFSGHMNTQRIHHKRQLYYPFVSAAVLVAMIPTNWRVSHANHTASQSKKCMSCNKTRALPVTPLLALGMREEWQFVITVSVDKVECWLNKRLRKIGYTRCDSDMKCATEIAQLIYAVSPKMAKKWQCIRVTDYKSRHVPLP